MTLCLIILLAAILAGLALEKRRALEDRNRLEHVVHVNGIRGKSTVTRLIDAGLRAGGMRVFCKTTGTDPMVIDAKGVQAPLYRRGRANIKEQLGILRRAVGEGAQVLVIECMAVDPVLQGVAQHQMLRADVGVITNVRLDHTAEMGGTLEEICDSLSNMIPRGGTLFTADKDFFPQLKANAAKVGCQAVLAQPTGEEPDFDFPENLALALAVCRYLGVPEETAMEGMLHYQRDPYALSLHILPGGGMFVNGLSINDPQSTELVFRRLREKYGWADKRIILLINNRPDRGYRTQHMAMVARDIQPDEVWLLGASQLAMTRAVKRDVPKARLRRFAKAEQVPLDQVPDTAVVFAAGNLAGPGRPLISRIREEARDV